MFPMLLPGDVATIDPLSIVALRPGDIVVFDRGDKWVAHRLTVIDNPEGKVLLVTQGDSCTSPDASFGQNEYRGVIRVVSRNGREIEQRHGAFVRLLLLRGNLIRPLIRACVRTMALWRAVMRRLR